MNGTDNTISNIINITNDISMIQDNITIMNSFMNFTNLNMTCVYMNDAIDSIIDMSRNMTQITKFNSSGIIMSGIFIIFSLFMLIFGGRYFKPSAACVVFVLSFCGIYKLTEHSSRLTCELRIIISSAIAIIGSVSTCCIINWALFIIGAISFGSIIHLVYASFPSLHTIFEGPEILNKSLLYWGTLLGAAIIGGIVVKWKHKESLEIMTSVIGGSLLAYSLHGIVMSVNANIDNWIFFVIATISSFTGVCVQRKLRLRKKKNKEKKEEKYNDRC